MIYNNPILLRTHSKLEAWKAHDQIDSGISNLAGRTIEHGRLRLVEKLGEGTYGVVYRAEDQWSASASSSTGATGFAVKVLEKRGPQTHRWMYVERELAAHQALSRHPNVLTLHRIVEDDEFYYMVLDYCPGGDLYRVIERATLAGKVDAIKKVFVQLLDAVEFCHENGIAHRDIKPENILFATEGTEHLVLSDFGLVTWAEKGVSHGCGSGIYMSPECVGDMYDYRPYSVQKSDVWSLGVVFLNLISGFGPQWDLASMNDAHFREFVDDPECLRDTFPISREANEILKDAFNLDPRLRITIPELRERVLEADTFFMSSEEIARANIVVKDTAQRYWANASPSACESAHRVRAASGSGSGDEYSPIAISISMVDSASSTLCSTPALSTTVTESSSDSGDDGSPGRTPEYDVPNPLDLLKAPEFRAGTGVGEASSSGVEGSDGGHLPGSVELLYNRLSMLFIST